MKIFLLFSLLLVFILPSDVGSKEPIIIYLKGTCSSGKSTLIRALLEENLKVVDEDSIMQRSYVEAVRDRFPENFPEIQKAISPENLYHALREKEVLFRDTSLPEERQKASLLLESVQEELNRAENLPWKQEVSRGIDREVLESIRSSLEQKKTVLLDSWYIQPKHLNALFPDVKVVRVMLYCPLDIAYVRFLRRNQEALLKGNLQEKRYLRQLVGTFFSLYQVSNDPLQPIETIQKEGLALTLEAISESLIGTESLYKKSVFTFEEIPQAYFLKMKDEFLHSFQENPKGCYYISPKEKQDLIIDNSKDLEESIQAFKALLIAP